MHNTLNFQNISRSLSTPEVLVRRIKNFIKNKINRPNDTFVFQPIEITNNLHLFMELYLEDYETDKDADETLNTEQLYMNLVEGVKDSTDQLIGYKLIEGNYLVNESNITISNTDSQIVFPTITKLEKKLNELINVTDVYWDDISGNINCVCYCYCDPVTLHCYCVCRCYYIPKRPRITLNINILNFLLRSWGDDVHYDFY